MADAARLPWRLGLQTAQTPESPVWSKANGRGQTGVLPVSSTAHPQVLGHEAERTDGTSRRAPHQAMADAELAVATPVGPCSSSRRPWSSRYSPARYGDSPGHSPRRILVGQLILADTAVTHGGVRAGLEVRPGNIRDLGRWPS